jgi:hypothetical protein
MNQIEKEAPVRSDASIDQTRRSAGRHVRAALLALVGGFALMVSVGAAPAMASFSISVTNNVTNTDGTPATQAGSHPYQMVTSLAFSTTSSGAPTENVKDVQVNLPPGLIGDPNATPKCTVQQLDSNVCPGATQVGLLGLTINIGSGASTIQEPLYNIVPSAGLAAQFGSNILVVNSFLDVTVRTGGDYGLTTSSFNISANLPVTGISVTLWGVPADPSHDAARTCPSGTGCSANAPLKPLLTMPTACSPSLTTTATADSWQSAGNFAPASYQSQDSAGNPIGVTGCGLLSFNPTISAQPDTMVADSPAGLNVDLHVPQAPDDPSALATPALKTAIVTLPAGVAVSPAAADGLQACTPAEIGMNNASEPSCPNASKVGSAEIDSALVSDPLVGSIYLAQQNNNPFGSLLAIYVSTEADGVLIKLAADVSANPLTGQLTTTFDNNPQLPFTDFKLNFFGGPRAALSTPETCGSFPVTSSISSWAGGTPATPSDSIPISSGCVNGFAPTFIAGVSNPQAGASSTFTLSFGRSDTDQELSGLTVSLPPGLLAHIGSVPMCSAAAAAAGTCPSNTQVGAALAGAGAGSHPFFLTGKVYLTGPYKGAPYGLVEVVPALAGPLNLGTVIVRQALQVNKTDAHVTVASDPFPTILDGIPLRLRRIDVTLNRSGFMVNPTNCTPMRINATVTSASLRSASVSSRFQVGGCGDLGFSPKLTPKLTGKGKTKAGNHPTLDVTLTGRSGQANLKSVKLTLPTSLALDAKNSQVVCSVAAAAADNCPAKTDIGNASATTPLLSHSLTGKVYLVQGIRRGSHGQLIRTLPSLLIPLRGAISLDLIGQTSVSHNKLVTTFPAIPDAPISKFALTINGGPHGILAVTRNLCKRKQVAGVAETGQNGKSESSDITMATPCPKSKSKKRK